MFTWRDGDLNKQQEHAVLHEGNIFLEACPGSGKTKTLTYKTAYELSLLNTKKEYVAAITYTNRAADEIHERIENMGVDTGQLSIGTIHSFCLEWIIKPYSIYHEDLQHGFRVINSHDSQKILTDICKDYKYITYWDCGYTFTTTGYQISCNIDAKKGSIHKILEKYFQILKDNKQIDFELILFYAHELITTHHPIRKLLSNIFRYILVDEYQDTKQIQYAILSEIIKESDGNTNSFIVGDPNQAIYQNLGGYAISIEELSKLTCSKQIPLRLVKNYRSTEKIVSYFSKYSFHKSDIQPASKDKKHLSNITFNKETHMDDVTDEVVRLIKLNIEELGISPNEICIVASQWIYLAGMTRRLVAKLPEYSFDGPGMVPFSRDIENFWYKVSKIVLTSSSPKMYVRRIRWAKEVLKELVTAGIDISGLTEKKLLKICNTIYIEEVDGLKYLKQFFIELCLQIKTDLLEFPYFKEHHDSFFESSQVRLDRLRKEGAEFISDISAFRKVFEERSGITVSTIHGVKGTEFDTVIAYALLDGLVPHSNEDNPVESSTKLLYVICSRARKHLHLISETGRRNNFLRINRIPTPVLNECSFPYD